MTRVLRQIAGSMRPYLASQRHGELDEVTRDYHDSIPLFVPISLMRQYEQQFAIDYPNRQTYFELYPIELTDCSKSQFAGCP